MAIPESQLETWSHQGATTTAKATHTSIQTALTTPSSHIGDRVRSGDVEVYLQGSYRNDTNIRGDSDVDVVVQLNSVFVPDTSMLPVEELVRFNQETPNATYTYSDFRRDVVDSLQGYYGTRLVRPGNKAIQVVADSGRLNADVLACLHHRKYIWYRGPSDQYFVEGVAFYTVNENRLVINYPKPHYENGVAKHGSTDQWFKPVVRVFKNARTRLVDEGEIAPDLAPSYFLQGLIYNVPDSCFGTSFDSSFVEAVNWLRESDFSSLVCQNDQHPLFGVTPERWTEPRARAFLDRLVRLWNDW